MFAADGVTKCEPPNLDRKLCQVWLVSW